MAEAAAAAEAVGVEVAGVAGLAVPVNRVQLSDKTERFKCRTWFPDPTT
jgi:hypothetical protein